MKKTIIALTALGFIGAIITGVYLAEPKESKTVAQPTPHKVVRAEKKKVESKKEQPKNEIYTEELSDQAVDEVPYVETPQEETQAVLIKHEVNKQVDSENAPQDVTEPINHIEPQQAAIKVAPQPNLSELDPALWTTLVNIAKTVNETPNNNWTVEEGQANFERMANKLHDMGGVPREDGVE